MSLRPCWYWMPMASQPKSSAMRSAAMYILQLVEDLVLGQLGRPVAARDGTCMPRLVEPLDAGPRLAVGHRRISATSADWLSRSL